jgi:hypothetical protein
MQWLSEQLGTLGGAAGLLTMLGGAFAAIKSWSDKRKAAILRDTELAPTLLAERQRAEHQRDEVTGQFKQATTERDDCHKARAECERLAKQCAEERVVDRARADHERTILHDALKKHADRIDELSAALEQAPGPYRAPGESLGQRTRKSLSQSNLRAAEPAKTIPDQPGYSAAHRRRLFPRGRR